MDIIALIKTQVDRPDLHHCVLRYGTGERSGIFVRIGKAVSIRHGNKHDTTPVSVHFTTDTNATFKRLQFSRDKQMLHANSVNARTIRN